MEVEAVIVAAANEPVNGSPKPGTTTVSNSAPKPGTKRNPFCFVSSGFELLEPAVADPVVAPADDPFSRRSRHLLE